MILLVNFGFPREKLRLESGRWQLQFLIAFKVVSAMLVWNFMYYGKCSYVFFFFCWTKFECDLSFYTSFSVFQNCILSESKSRLHLCTFFIAIILGAGVYFIASEFITKVENWSISFQSSYSFLFIVMTIAEFCGGLRLDGFEEFRLR